VASSTLEHGLMGPVVPFRLKLLGGFEAQQVDGTAIGITAKKSRALLAYLALTRGRTHQRGKLADLLWSDRGDKQARDSLRQALAELRDALADVQPAALATDHELVSLAPVAVDVDALRFAELAGRDSAEELRRAASLYDGDLLDSLDVRDVAFDDWLSRERQRYRELMVASLKKLLPHETGAAAMAVAQRVLTLDPLEEGGHRALMRLFAEAGDIAAALRQYDTCRATLKRELDIAPSPETEVLHRQIRDQSTMRLDSDRHADTSTDAPQPQTAGASKPTVAVLPFSNLSGDPNQQYFSDGIAEDIITELSRFRSLFVIARNSSFQYRDRATDVRRIAQELNVQFVVEGSVRKGGDRLRITAQLIDATTGTHLWVERYDRSLDDVFAVQDEVVHTIVGTLEGRLATRIAEQARSKPTHSMVAYECALKARGHLSTFDAEAAEPLLRRAIELDPNYAQAYGGLAMVYLANFFHDPRPELLDRALEEGKKGLALDESDARCHATLGTTYLFRRQFELAGLHFERARSLNANDVTIGAAYAHWLCRVGRVEEALIEFDKALQLDPLPPRYYWESRSVALVQARRFLEAIDAIRRMNRLFSWNHAALAACHAQLGQMGEARAEAAEALRMQPNFTVSWLLQEEPFKYSADAGPMVDGMRMAGIPQ
jgi:TolB-like protein/Flp pilus assembly protein TadD